MGVYPSPLAVHRSHVALMYKPAKTIQKRNQQQKININKNKKKENKERKQKPRGFARLYSSCFALSPSFPSIIKEDYCTEKKKKKLLTRCEFSIGTSSRRNMTQGNKRKLKTKCIMGWM